MIGSTQLNHFLLKRFTSQQVILVTLLYQSLAGLVMVYGTWAGWYGKIELIALMFVFLTGQGLTNPNAAALSLAPFSRLAGSASALMGSFRMGMGGLTSAAVSLLHNGTALPMVGVMTLCAVGGLMVLLIGRTTTQYGAREEDLEEEASRTII
jgi:DHA1 family bicyclomycin/chloramphenicol resistance-like MFS transporter